MFIDPSPGFWKHQKNEKKRKDDLEKKTKKGGTWEKLKTEQRKQEYTIDHEPGEIKQRVNRCARTRTQKWKWLITGAVERRWLGVAKKKKNGGSRIKGTWECISRERGPKSSSYDGAINRTQITTNVWGHAL